MSLNGVFERYSCPLKSGGKAGKEIVRGPKKERTDKGSVGPFIKGRRKGSVDLQYENGIRGNAIFDSF
jgi:hypothetical protein